MAPKDNLKPLWLQVTKLSSRNLKVFTKSFKGPNFLAPGLKLRMHFHAGLLDHFAQEG